MRVYIREGNETDLEDLVLIGRLTFALACPLTTPKADLENYITAEFNSEKFKQCISDPKVTLYVAEISGKAVGYCLLCCSNPPLEKVSDRAVELKRLYVLPEFHGVGVAQKLMQAALKFASANDYAQVWLSVSSQNIRAISFYKKSEFVKAGEQKFYVGNDIHDDDIMVNTVLT